MVTGNQNRGREEKNLEKLLYTTSDPQIYVPNKPPKGPGAGPGSATHLPDERTLENKNYKIHPFFQDIGWGTDFYSNLNNANGYGGGMQDVSAQRGAGGTGGGSEDTEGNMDANQLLTLNPYLSKNVTSFNDGGMFGEFAKYNHDQIKRKEFIGQNNINPYQVQAENGMRMPEYNNGGMMPQQQMPQQTESYAKQANDMIALAQLEAFGKKFALQMPQEAADGMKRLYQQGGNYPHNMYNKETGYKIVAEDEAAHTKLAGAGFDHTPKAKYGMKMKKYTQGGRF